MPSAIEKTRGVKVPCSIFRMCSSYALFFSFSFCSNCLMKTGKATLSQRIENSNINKCLLMRSTPKPFSRYIQSDKIQWDKASPDSG